MIKMLLVVLLIAILLIGGVIELKIHPDQIRHIPARLFSYVQEPTTVARASTALTDLKRRGEQLIVRDTEKRFELSLGYVKADAEALQKLIAEEGDKGEQALARADLLANSMDRVERQLGDVPVEVLTKFKDTTRESFAQAEASLKSLNEKREAYAALEERFGVITKRLGEQLSSLFAATGKGSEDGDVAGTTSEEPAAGEASPEPINAIPLNF